jgi:hypothetical protein
MYDDFRFRAECENGHVAQDPRNQALLNWLITELIQQVKCFLKNPLLARLAEEVGECRTQSVDFRNRRREIAQIREVSVPDPP